MKLSQYNYSFSPDMLAKYPAESRDESRLMVLNRRTGKIEHKVFKEMIDYFRQGDVLVFNDTKVFPARLYGNKEKTGAEIEIFLLRELNRDLRLWDVLVDPARKIRIGNKLYFGDDDLMVAEVIDNTTSRGRTLRFLFDGDYDEFKAALYKLGETPLPKWIRPKVEPIDEERYQTIFAKNEGAVAAPTAGLHFSKHLMKRLEIKGVDMAFLTLHVGLGNFRTVDVEDLTKHKMDSEQVVIPERTAEAVNRVKRAGGKDEQVHILALRIQRGQLHDHQLPSTVLHPADDGGRLRRLRRADERLRRGQEGKVPFRHLRRRDADSLRRRNRRPGCANG